MCLSLSIVCVCVCVLQARAGFVVTGECSLPPSLLPHTLPRLPNMPEALFEYTNTPTRLEPWNIKMLINRNVFYIRYGSHAYYSKLACCYACVYCVTCNSVNIDPLIVLDQRSAGFLWRHQLQQCQSLSLGSLKTVETTHTKRRSSEVKKLVATEPYVRTGDQATAFSFTR